ncbi:hypothetical protein LEN26_006203 [Aphanomyces euteiches]|nr:hypothetical protein AeMF1_021222 [Aphanomyces euteiches]KAH9136338.1 hypothetical protein LEN26_006203 [Aphanomyces euteiches]
MHQPRVSRTSRKLRESVACHRPELVPLFEVIHKAESPHQPWKIQTPADAVKLSTFLHSKMLLSPELNRNSSCYIARRIVQLYIKLKYIATFPAQEIDDYSSLGDQEYDEVRMVHYLMAHATAAAAVSTASIDLEPIYRLAAMLGISPHSDSWPDVVKFVVSALPFAEHTETLLVRGSDDRSLLDSITKTNKYNTSTIPAALPDHAWISRASCTSSTISLDQFTAAERLRQELLLASLSINHDNIADAFDRKMHSVRLRLAQALGLDNLFEDRAFECIISPSGTDAELLATSAALARMLTLESPSNPRGTVTCVVTAQGETGSGSVNASAGQHFSKITPSGESVDIGKALAGFPSTRVTCVQIPARQTSGHILDADAAATTAVRDALSSNPNNVALLHVVLGSKTGLSCPSLGAVAALTDEFGSRLVVVVDACQMRLDRAALADFLALDYIVLVTGSKFFAGVPFCGSVLVPAQLASEMNAADARICFPPGFGQYFSKHGFPPSSMERVRETLPARMNVGLLLRWETALVHMQVYASIPSAIVAQISHDYITRAKAMLLTHAHIQLLDAFDAPAKRARPAPRISSTGLPLQPLDTIISFHIVDANNELLAVSKLKTLHALLAKDLSDCLAADDVALARKKCLVGQPVSLGTLPHGVLRIALGADMVNAIFQGTKTMSELVLEDAIIVRKIQLILVNWAPLVARYVEAPATSTTVPAAPVLTNASPLSPPSSSAMPLLPATNYTAVVRSLVAKFPFVHAAPRTLVYDLDAIDMAFQSLVAPFPPHFEHRFAVSACPFAFFLRRAIENDIGLTCATLVEVQHALRLGCAPHKIVFASPSKSQSDIRQAIDAGVDVTADSFVELDVIRAHAQQRFQSNFPECTPRYAGELPRIGVRVHACRQHDNRAQPPAPWTVGVPLSGENRTKIIQAFVDNPWLSSLQAMSCGPEDFAFAAHVLCDLANEIDAVVGEDRVKVLNLGGANGGCSSPTLGERVDSLHVDAPKVFERHGRTVLIEYGMNVSAKAGWTLFPVEQVRKNHDDAPTAVVVPVDGADLTATLADGTFQHRVSIVKSSSEATPSETFQQELVSFSGGKPTVRSIQVPQIESGDFVILHDTGAGTLVPRNCGMPAPAVCGYRKTDDALKIVLLKSAESPEQAMHVWG